MGSFAIDNVNVWGLEESVIASGLPMLGKYDADEFAKQVSLCRLGYREKDMRRAYSLASCGKGQSHDCFLCGIIVQMNITAPRYWWPEAQRYKFMSIVSSMSTMHRLKAMLEGKPDRPCELFTDDTPEWLLEQFIREAMNLWGSDADSERKLRTAKAMLPEGFLLTARLTTNYRSLKTMYTQRHDHRLSEWRDMCAWMESLPHSGLITGAGMPAELKEKK